MRVLLAALGLSALSFAAGVAGDLSIASPSHPESVVVQIPPLPPNAVRAHPLPPLTDSAEAAEVHAAPAIAPAHRHNVRRAHARRTAAVIASKPRMVQALTVSKFDRGRPAKWDI
jgi:hypothetical protein